MARYIVANTERECQFWLIFRIKLIQSKLLVHILDMLPRIVIWNETTKWVILVY